MNGPTLKLLRVMPAACIAVAFLVSCGMDEGAEGGGDKAVAVAVAKAERRDVQTTLRSIGRLSSKNAPLLASEINARVVEVLFDEGDAVAAGQVLVRLDTTAFELARREAQAAIEGLEISIANEQRRVKRYRDLKTTNALSQERLDDAEAQLAGSKAAKAAAEARLAIAEDRLSKAELASPVEGVIDRRHVSVGDYVRPGDPMMLVADTRWLRAELPFPETVAHELKPGQAVRLESLAVPGRVFESSVERIRPQVGSANRALVAIVELENPGGWRPEGTVEATVILDRRPGAVIVPVTALVQRPAGMVVYLLDEAAGAAHQQVVEPGQRQNGWIEIRSGLEPGETVISDGAHYLTDGARVNVVEEGP